MLIKKSVSSYFIQMSKLLRETMSETRIELTKELCGESLLMPRAQDQNSTLTLVNDALYNSWLSVCVS